jgi:hypothetical protein
MAYVVTIQTVSDLKTEINRLKLSRSALSDELELADREIALLKADVADCIWIVAALLIKFSLLLNRA